MATTFQNQVASINAAAAHFALQGYYVNLVFCYERSFAECTIYFYEFHKRDELEDSLSCFADEEDKVIFNELRTTIAGTFYSLRLKKRLHV